MRVETRTALVTLMSVTMMGGGLLAFQAGEITLPEGTLLILELNDYLSTRINKEGNPFTAALRVPVTLSDRLVIPKGSLVSGTVSRVVRPGRFRGKAILNLSFQSVRIQGKGELPIVASLSRLDAPQGGVQVLEEGSLRGEGSTGRDAGKIAAPSLAGAGIGAMAGGGTGAAIGAGIGVAVGLGTVFTTRGKDLDLRRGSTMEIRLDRPLQIPPDSPHSEIRQK